MLFLSRGIFFKRAAKNGISCVRNILASRVQKSTKLILNARIIYVTHEKLYDTKKCELQWTSVARHNRKRFLNFSMKTLLIIVWY